jgi:hypothetical protein
LTRLAARRSPPIRPGCQRRPLIDPALREVRVTYPQRRFLSASEALHHATQGVFGHRVRRKNNLPLRKHPDRQEHPRDGLTVQVAEAIADGDEGLIFLDLPEEEYETAGLSTTFAPGR